MIYWFTGASMQAVTTGAYRAVEFIKTHIKLDSVEKASVKDSKKVVEICTRYAQKGMLNIFLAVFFVTLAFAIVEPYFFIGYLISIAIFGLYQAIFMANAGGAWDNAKKIVETELSGRVRNCTPLRCRRYCRRSVQRYFVRGAQSDHQVHDAVRPAGRGTRCVAFEGPRHDRQLSAVGFVSSGFVRVCLSLLLQHADHDTAVPPGCHVAPELVLSCIVWEP